MNVIIIIQWTTMDACKIGVCGQVVVVHLVDNLAGVCTCSYRVYQINLLLQVANIVQRRVHHWSEIRLMNQIHRIDFNSQITILARTDTLVLIVTTPLIQGPNRTHRQLITIFQRRTNR